MMICPAILAASLLLASGPGDAQASPAPAAAELFEGGPSHPELRALAQADLSRRLEALLPGSPSGLPPGCPFGVEKLSDLRGATVGLGFEVHTLSPDAAASLLPLEQALAGTGHWRFVVIAGGRPVALMTLARVGGEMGVVEVGASRLAGLITQLAAAHGGGTTARLRFIRIPAAHQDFLAVTDRAGGTAFYRVSDAGERIGGEAIRALACRH